MTQHLVIPKLALFDHPAYVDLAMRLDNYTNAIDDNPSYQSCRVFHAFLDAPHIFFEGRSKWGFSNNVFHITGIFLKYNLKVTKK
ncbi:hypothetical protein HanIR_Chr04g0187111 [Helianthus annuus]|nr:hypothetical protein HanIR_Chr16g0831181 [Helianthus annuus]KAJ0520218.1 hypothetical protein HanIR_Chr10g0456931 [Helianthus annuus]KAJ0589515.1 hypothetical protein HanIR_Chr04g0187111 [Helianthus annuus]